MILIENIRNIEISNQNILKEIFLSDKLTYKEKEIILLKKIPDSMIKSYAEISDAIIDVILNANIKMEETSFIFLIKNSTSEEYKVRLANKMIKDLDYDENDIDEILSLLGDKYEDIILNEDGVTLDNTLWNKELVTTLKTKGYILNPRTAENKNIRIKKK